VTDDDILRDYLPWLRTVASNMLSPGHEGVQDLVQEGYIAMWKAIRTYVPGKGQLDYWLKFKASHRMKTLAIRKPEALPSLDVPQNEEGGTLADLIEGPDLLSQIDIAYHHGEIAAAIDRLTPQQKRYVIARFWLGLSGNEMRELGVFAYDPSALWNSQRNGARRKLQKELAHLRPPVAKSARYRQA
jgi:RNA polymerase sigma factor (sigma-70 family)